MDNNETTKGKKSTKLLLNIALIGLILVILKLLFGGVEKVEANRSSGASIPECDSNEGLLFAKERFSECFSLMGNNEVKEIESPTETSFNENANKRNCTGTLVTAQGRQYPTVYSFSVLNDGTLWTDIQIETPTGTNYSKCSSQ